MFCKNSTNIDKIPVICYNKLMNKFEKTQTKLALMLSNVDVVVKSETVSTNYDAREMSSGLSRPLLVLADRQSGGRGRQGKAFYSPKGGLYMTLALPCGLPLSEIIGVTSCTAVAVSQAIEKVCGAVCGIKWVNDIYLNGGKLCGILVESINDYSKMTSEVLLIGIGVNLIEAPNITDSEVKAVSLKGFGISCDRDELCVQIVKNIIAMQKDSFDFKKYVNEYRSRSIVLGNDVIFTQNGEKYNGKAIHITENGALTVDCSGCKITLDSGEIHLRIRT